MENKLLFYIADVSGHGVFSAIISSFVKALLDNWIKNDHIISPLDLVNRLKNSLKTEEIFHENMLTLFVGNIDITTLEMTYLSAGHHMPVIIKGNKEHIKLESSFRPISNLLDYDSYYEEKLTISNDTRMLFFSDGLIEWKRADNSISGKSFLLDYINRNGLSRKSILDLINTEINDRQEDDISFIFIDINDRFENRYYCTLENFNFIINDIKNELTKRYVLDDRIQSKIYNCLDEAIVNAIEHGNGNSIDLSVDLRINFGKDKIIFCILDEGDGFDWKKVLEDKSIQTDKIRGRGYFVIKHFTNGFYLNEKGNEITMTFILS
jgi:sigma-B regulation protein RsbU (phosphoserine phosphatase)